MATQRTSERGGTRGALLFCAAAVLLMLLLVLLPASLGLYRLRTPWALFFLLFTPFVLRTEHRRRVLAWFGWARGARPVDAVRFAAPVRFSELRDAAVTWRTRWSETVLSLLRVSAFLLLVVALARPERGTAFREVETSGRDIMLTLDLSGSMQLLDFSLEGKRVNRLAALKSVVESFIDAREGDRMGLVGFGAEVFTQSPLTTDRGALKQFVDALEVGMVGESTSVGDAIGISVKRLMSIEGNSKVIILVTDGKSNSGVLQPDAAAKAAKDLGVKIYTVGIGGSEPAPFPVKDVFGNTRYVMRGFEYDEETLKAIADITGGKYYNAKNTEALTAIYHEIDRLEERAAKSFEYIDYEERFTALLLAGLLLFVAGELLAGTIFLRVP